MFFLWFGVWHKVTVCSFLSPLLKEELSILFYVLKSYAHMYVYVLHLCLVEGQKVMSGSPKLEWRMVLSCHVVSWNRTPSSVKQEVLLIFDPALQALENGSFLKVIKSVTWRSVYTAVKSWISVLLRFWRKPETFYTKQSIGYVSFIFLSG